MSDINLLTRSQELFDKAFELQRKGLYEDAIDNYRKSINLYPTAKAFTYLGWTYSFLGDLDKAIEECKNAIEIDPEYGNPYNDIGAYLMQQFNFDEAIIWFELALNTKNYEHYEFAHLNLGIAYERKGLWFEALEEYKKAIKINPDYDPAKSSFLRLQGFLN